MLILDWILLAVVLALAAWRLIAPEWRPRLRIAVVGLALLMAAAQWALYGFTWQSLPAYLLLAVAASPSLRTGVTLRWTGRLGILAMAAACICVWIFPAVPTLPSPNGPFAVATEVYRWTDASRGEPHTADPGDRRSVIAQAWYPTGRRSEASGATRLPYIDGIGHMPDRVSVLPGFLLHRYGQIETHAQAMAPLAPSDQPWPVVIFSPGYGAPRAAYTGLATQLASRGFVVFVLDHPYESGVTQLPDGQVVGLREIFPADRAQYMPNQQALRTADIRFVIDQLRRPEALSSRLGGGRIETAKVGVIGHSFGGAASVMALSQDPRVAAAVNIDGALYGDLPDRRLDRPFMLIQSDQGETHHGELFIIGNGRLLIRMTAPGFHFEIKGANHYSFTDTPLFFSPPGRWLLGLVMGGGRGPAATHQVTADLVAAFLSGPLKGVPADVAATAVRQQDVATRTPGSRRGAEPVSNG